MHSQWLWLLTLCTTGIFAAGTTSSSDSPQFTTLSSTLSVGLPSSTATSESSGASGSGSTTSGSASSTTTQGSTSTITLLVGGGGGVETLSVINGTSTIFPNSTATTTSGSGSSTSSTPRPTNTQPCNGWVEFCDRSYSNITFVAAHNAAFSIKGNAASNQIYSLTTQLNDGVRMLTGETQWVNNTFYACHTTCDLLNAGTLQANLQEVATWVKANPYDVVTILIVNSNFRPVEDYVDTIQGSGLAPYLYEPPHVPMRLDEWPTLQSMILSQKRVVIFMDYNANQTSVPYILDEFAHMWETPFSPQNISFPCDLQRPPSLTNLTEARDDYMYLANHNLNQAVSFAGTSFLIPNSAFINTTNAAGYDTGMMGLMANNCQAEWAGRPPNWLLVDYYNANNGSVFEVAARLNNVTWDGKCCGTTTSAAPRLGQTVGLMLGTLFGAVIWLTM
ncbi:PLC-like phosphodiesterase [Myriangium duriaei CBS 260.36]|uniref:PLC-like phosphodiesterase n=1 Tax=Myriangium duriaei CBS 260.36 TaxID=1168546 RepID=A0A9P4JAP0_9PEZI|nr:PLC-like phosphodiesterase [Myriangium duriaei CBS 260.36]